MASKNNPDARKGKASAKKHVGSCGHETIRVLVVPAKGRARLRWYCEQEGRYDD